MAVLYAVFEVFSDDLNLMEKQAEKIATWGKNVNVKISNYGEILVSGDNLMLGYWKLGQC